MSKKIKIVLVDDHELFRSGIKALLEKQEDMHVTKEFSNSAGIMDYMKTNSDVDLILLDINLPDTNGVEATKYIKEVCPSVKIIILTMYDDGPYLIKAMKNGASGYMLKEAATTELIGAIRTAIKGDMAIYPSMIETLVNKALAEEPVGVGNKKSTDDVLTKREKEVIHYIALGFTNQEIADKLSISIKTSEKHKSNIMEKLDLKKRHEIVKYAVKKGLADLNSICE